MPDRAPKEGHLSCVLNADDVLTAPARRAGPGSRLRRCRRFDIPDSSYCVIREGLDLLQLSRMPAETYTKNSILSFYRRKSLYSDEIRPQQVGKSSSEAVQTPHCGGVVGSKVFDDCGQLWAIVFGAGCDVCPDLVATRGPSEGPSAESGPDGRSRPWGYPKVCSQVHGVAELDDTKY